MKVAGWILFFYALFIIAGGVMGYTKAASTASLIAGTLFGVILLVSSVGTMKNRLVLAFVGVVATLILDAFFTYRFLTTFRFFPSGMMSVLSTAVLLSTALLLRASHQK